MEEAAVHAIDNLAGWPALIFVLGILAIIALVAIVVIPKWSEFKQKKLDNDAEAERIRLDNEAKHKAAQLDIEREREARKRDEANQRFERDKEMTAIMARSVDAQERSNVAITESNAQMALLHATLELSQKGSAGMRDKVDDMAAEVHDIHRVVMK